MATLRTGVDEWLDIDGTPLDTLAWMATDLSGLWDGPDIRGEGFRLLPGVAGGAPRPVLPAPSRRLVPMAFLGDHDPDGEEHEDAREGLWSNIAEFRALMAAWRSPVTVTVHVPDGTLTGLVRVMAPLSLSVTATSALGVLELLVFDGALVHQAGS
jgi:hypothetical protein